MRKLLLLLLLVSSSLLFGQSSPKFNFVIDNATTAFGINLPRGCLIYDLDSGKLYVLTVAAASTATLSTSTKVQVYPSPWIRDDGNSLLYLSTLTDEVGIGTNSPSYALDVVGTAEDAYAGRFVTRGNTNISALYSQATATTTTYEMSAIKAVMIDSTGNGSSQLLGVYSEAKTNADNRYAGSLYGGYFKASNIGTQTIPLLIGVAGLPSASASNTTTLGIGFYSLPLFTYGSMTTWKGLYLAPSSLAFGASITNLFGIDIADYTTGTHNTIFNIGTSRTGNYALHINSTKDNYFAGNVGIKDYTPSYELDVTGNVNLTGNLTFDAAGSSVDAWTTTIASDDDTDVPTEGAVYDYCSGFLTSEVDGSVTNEGNLSAGQGETYAYLQSNTSGDSPINFINSTGMSIVAGTNSLTFTSVPGTGTDNYIPQWNGTTTLENSPLYAISSRQIGLGTTTSLGPVFSISHEETVSYAPVQTTGYYNGVASVGNFLCRVARGTASSPSATQLDDIMGGFAGRGYGTTDFASGGRVQILGGAAENWTDAAQGTYIKFTTTPIGTATATEKGRFTGTGLGINTTASDKSLEVNSSTGANLRLTYNDANGSAADYTDITTGSDGDLTINSTGGDVTISDSLKLPVIAESITASTLYYNESTDLVTYGDTPDSSLWERDAVNSEVYLKNSDHDLGIGTSDPAFDFHLYNSSDLASFMIESPYSGETMRNIGYIRIKNATSGHLFNFAFRKNTDGHEVIQSVYDGSSTWYEFMFFNVGTQKYEVRSGVHDAEFNNSGDLLLNPTEEVAINTDDPSSTLDVNGSFALPTYTMTSTPITLDATQHTILVNMAAASGDWTINLPSPVTYPGRIYLIKTIDLVAAYNLIISTGTGYIKYVNGDTTTSKTISDDTKEGCSVTLQSDGTNWWIIDWSSGTVPW